MWPSFWRTFDLYSLAGFKYVIDQLEEYQTVNDTDEGFVETLRLIAELVIYGDQHDPSVFEFFMEKQVMAQFLNILKVNNNSDVALQLLQTLSIMIQSLQSEHAIYYLFSNEYINNLITYPFEFQNEELIFYYISFLRTISGRLDKNTISLLVKTQHDAVVSFPLYSEAIKFFNHQDNMICIAVRALTLSIYRVNDHSVNKFITTHPLSEYFSDLVKHLKQNTFKLDALVVRAAQIDDASDIKKMLVSTIEEIDDDLYYLSDILCASVSDLSGPVTHNLLHTLVFPMLLPSLHLSHSNSMQIRATTSLYILSRLLQVVNSKEVANTISAAFLCPPRVATTSFNCECDKHESKKSVLASGIPMVNINRQTEEQASGISVVNTNTETKEQASGISMVNINTHSIDQEDQHMVVKPFKEPCINVGLLEESEKDRKSNVSSILPSFVSYENYKLVLASLSLLVLLLENKELKNSLLEALGILPPKMQCQKLSEAFDSLIRLLCSRPRHGEAMWHIGWLLKNILPYLETKLFDHHLNVFVLFHQVVNLILRGTFPEIPPLDLIKEFPASSRAKCAGLDCVALKVGVEVNLGEAIPCRIAFEEGKEMHVCMLAVVKGAHGWLLLAEEVLSKPQRGVVIAHAPLAGLKPKVDEIHPRWLHLQIRADLPSFGSKIAAIGRYRTNQMSDGRWTLAFSDEQACKYANLMILDEMAIQKSFVKYALESLLRVDAIMKVEEESLKDFSSA
ncbi:protein TRANSPARENT TESTA 9 isoform X4 [Cryptomeria japonica]|uniref:protein TRANSPARENT TESTA 9 isoform X4 n=1 Tax=Cryptomeria japonica TaxID=3369 RepID=UPI0025AC6772|nr:protein TRANSPARENT TESTA 9 isoform X4 [Cryptomeria japonica]